MKQSKRSKSALKISDENNSYLPRIFGIGDLDLTYTLKTTSDKLEKVNINLENINSQDDLNLIVNEKSLWGSVVISSENSTIDTLLNITKMAEGEIFTEFVPFEFPDFENKNLEKMLDEINGANYLYINKAKLFSSSYHITFVIETDIDSVEIELYTKIAKNSKKKKKNNKKDEEEEEEEEPKEEEPKEEEPKEEESKEKIKTSKGEEAKVEETKKDSKETKEKSKADGAKKVEKKEKKKNSKNEAAKTEETPENVKLSNSNSPLNQIKLTCEKYEYFFINFTDSTKIDPFSDFIELLSFFKTKLSSNIIIKFTDILSIFDSEEDMIQLNRVYFMTDTFIMTLNDAIRNFNSHYDIFCKKPKEIKPIDL